MRRRSLSFHEPPFFHFGSIVHVDGIGRSGVPVFEVDDGSSLKKGEKERDVRLGLKFKRGMGGKGVKGKGEIFFTVFWSLDPRGCFGERNRRGRSPFAIWICEESGK